MEWSSLIAGWFGCLETNAWAPPGEDILNSHAQLLLYYLCTLQNNRRCQWTIRVQWGVWIQIGIYGLLLHIVCSLSLSLYLVFVEKHIIRLKKGASLIMCQTVITSTWPSDGHLQLIVIMEFKDYFRHCAPRGCVTKFFCKYVTRMQMIDFICVHFVTQSE